MVNLRIKNKKKYLDFEINNIPEKIDLNYSKDTSKDLIKIYKENLKSYKSITNDIYIYDSNNLKTYLNIGGIAIFLGLFFCIINFNSNIKAVYFFSTFIIIGVFYIFIGLLKKNKELFILNRKQGLLSYPDFIPTKSILSKFDNAAIFIGSVGKYGVSALKLRHKNKFTNYSFSILDTNFWSFMVWYMDKNRPLPPGDAFDAYRQKDFERRKSEGFPPPLYYSNGILTPEATPEQQLEREQYWKDQEYFAPPIKRPENSEIFNTRTHKNWGKVTFDRDGSVLSNTWHEFTFNNKVVYMLTNENGSGYLPPENESYKVASLTLKDSLF